MGKIRIRDCFLKRSDDSHQLCLLLLHLWHNYSQNYRRMVLEKKITMPYTKKTSLKLTYEAVNLLDLNT